MLSIRPTETCFKQNTRLQKRKRQETSAMCLGITLAVGSAVLLGRKLSVKSFEKALEKNGVEIKDGIAVLKETGEKYTGEIKRRIGKFGLKTETTKYENGIITEKICYNFFGQEIKDYLAKNII